MKKNRILAFALGCAALLAFSGCDKLSDSGADTSNVIIRLAVNGTSTRTSGSTVDDDTAESTVSDVRLFLLKDSDIDDITELTLAEGEKGSVEAINLDGNVIKVTLPYTFNGSWHLYVLANWPDGLTLDTTDFESFVGSFEGLTSTQIAELCEENHFLMVNVQNSETVADTDMAGVPFTFSNTTCDSDHPLEVTVNLERVVSKVRVASTNSTTYPIIGTLMGTSDAVYGVSKVDIEGFSVINCVNSFNLIQQWDSDSKLVTPSSDPSYSLADGYYDKFSSSLTFQDNGTVKYILENNSPEFEDAGGSHLDAVSGTKMKSRTTGVIIKARVKSLSTYTSEANTDMNDDEFGENLVLDPYEGAWTSFSTKAGSTDAEYRTLYRYNGVLFADAAQLFTQNPSLGYDPEDTPAAADLRNLGVSVYEDGYMYFTYWFETQGEYCVMRNVYYNILINSITGFGDDLPGGRYVGTDPLEKNGPLISIGMKIEDWVENTVNHYTL